MYEEVLGAARTQRGKINMFVLIIAFVLCCVNVNTYRMCKDNGGTKKFEDDGLVKMSYWGSIIVIVLACILMAYDIAIFLRIIK